MVRVLSFRALLIALLGVMMAGAAVFMVMPQANAKDTKQASTEAHKGKTITRTFQSSALTIPDVGPASPYPATFAVNGKKLKKAKVKSASVTINGLTHTFPSDLAAMLVNPSGRQTTLFSDPDSGNDVSNVNLNFSDTASGTLPCDDSQIVSGTYHPNDCDPGDTTEFVPPAPTPTGNTNLSVFNGSKAKGNWQLYVNDDAAGDSGSTNGATLTLKMKVKKPHHHRH